MTKGLWVGKTFTLKNHSSTIIITKFQVLFETLKV